MKTVNLEVTGVDSSRAISVDYNHNDFKVGLGITVTGTATYTVEHSFDDPDEATVWFPHPDLTDKTGTEDGNYAYPIRQIRVTNTIGTGTTTLRVVFS